jgi:GNAT superfamily N-acetyltransferase
VDNPIDSLVIRPALPDDAAALARVLIDTGRVAHRGQVPDHLLDATPLAEKYARSERNWRRNLDEIAGGFRPLERILVAVDGGNVVGLGMACPRGIPEPRFAAFAGEVNVLYVLPGHQRRGVGRRLLRALVQHLVDVGLPSLVIQCVSANLPARRFYAAMGGTLVGERIFEDEGELLPSSVFGWTAADTARLIAAGLRR